MIRSYTKNDAAAVLQLWNTAGTKAGYAPQTAEGLNALLLEHPEFHDELTFVLEDGGAVCGFVNGCVGDHLAWGKVRGYVSCLLLDEAHDDEANTRLLLSALEDVFRQKGRTYAAVTFFCPIRLPWIIPGTDGHQHNNMPGIATDLPLCDRMKAFGYRQAATEQAMYLDLAGYETPDWIGEKAARMAARGYTVDWYREGAHHGVDEMVASLNNSMWSAEVPAAAHSGMKLLVGLQGDTVAGFTGPVYPEKTGRGYFAGLAVAAQYEKNGLGTLLFYRLLEAEKSCGAKYMSLFTGTDNHAQEIYKNAGFEARRYFGVMLKEL